MRVYLEENLLFQERGNKLNYLRSKSVYYFGFFLILAPFIGWIEKPNKLPLSISEVYSKNFQPNIGGREREIQSSVMQKDTNL